MDETFSCSEMVGGGGCWRHHAHQYTVMPLQTATAVRAFDIYVSHTDRGKGHTSDPVALRHASKRRLVYSVRTPAPLSGELRAALLDANMDRQQKIDAISTQYPHLCPETFANVSSQDLAYHLHRALACTFPSIDLTRQRDDWQGGSGRVIGHCGNSVREVPRYFQERFSSHPFALALVFCGVVCNAAKQITLLDQLDSLAGLICEIDNLYLQRHGHVDDDPMTREQCSLSDELHSILEETQSHSLGALVSAISRPSSAAPEPRTPSRQDSPYILRRRPEVSRLLLEELQQARGMDDDQIEQWVQCVANFARSVEEAHGSVQPTQYNADGMPTTFWHSATPTRTIIEMAAVKVKQAMEFCEDEESSEIVLVDRGGRPLWPLVVLSWIAHHGQYGSRDALCGLSFDVSRTSRSFSPSLLAHKTHKRPFFSPVLLRTDAASISPTHFMQEANTTVQIARVNYWLTSKPGSWVIQSLYEAKQGSIRVLERLASAKAIDMSEEQLREIRECPVIIASDAQFVRHNR